MHLDCCACSILSETHPWPLTRGYNALVMLRCGRRIEERLTRRPSPKSQTTKDAHLRRDRTYNNSKGWKVNACGSWIAILWSSESIEPGFKLSGLVARTHCGRTSLWPLRNFWQLQVWFGRDDQQEKQLYVSKQQWRLQETLARLLYRRSYQNWTV